MHLKDIKIVDSFILTGRGRAHVTDLDYDAHRARFKVGDTFRIDDKIYEVLSIEACLKADGDKRRDFLSFITKEISTKELFIKVFEPKHDPKTMEDVEWRIRNRWWRKPWQKMQLFYLANIKPIFTKK